MQTSNTPTAVMNSNYTYVLCTEGHQVCRKQGHQETDMQELKVMMKTPMKQMSTMFNLVTMLASKES